jgi:tetratricopeptide (TPR) repeat protein
MAHLAYGRRFFIEARVRYEEAATLAPDGREAALDLLQAGHAASALLHGDIAYERFLEAADRAEEVGEARTAAIAMALAAERPSRMMATFPKLPDRAVVLEHLARAHALGDGLDAVVAAHLAVADAWNSVERGPSSTRWMAEEAVAATRAAADPVTESSALDALAAATWDDGEMAESAKICLDRALLLPQMDSHDPRCGTEIIDTLHMGADGPLALGDLAVATDFAEQAVHHPLAGGALHLLQRELVVGYCLTGRFEEAVTHGDIMRTAWQRIGGPTAGWMAPATYLLALVHGLLGHGDESDEWMEFSHQMSLDEKNAVRSFAVIRLALHEGRFDEAAAELDRYSDGTSIGDKDRPWSVAALGYAPYVWAIACDAWAARDQPDAADRIGEVRASTPQHLWAAPCLLRAEGRLTGDDALLAQASEAFGVIGARFEQAVTESLRSGGGAERGREALRDLGCAPEQRP